MSSKKEICIRAIEKIRQDIDILDAGDPQAWDFIGTQMAVVVEEFPKNLSVPRKTLALCARSVAMLAEDTQVRSFTLIEALSEALGAVGQYLQADSKSERKPALQAAEGQLQAALARVDGQGTKAGNTAAKAEMPLPVAQATLDDAAALLIQLEPDDQAGRAQLQSALQAVGSDPNLPDSSRQYVAAAAEKVEALESSSAQERDTALRQAGELLENAMEAADDLGEPARRPASDPAEPTARCRRRRRYNPIRTAAKKNNRSRISCPGMPMRTCWPNSSPKARS